MKKKNHHGNSSSSFFTKFLCYESNVTFTRQFCRKGNLATYLANRSLFRGITVKAEYWHFYLCRRLKLITAGVVEGLWIHTKKLQGHLVYPTCEGVRGSAKETHWSENESGLVYTSVLFPLGFHNIFSVFQILSICFILNFSTLASGEKISLSPRGRRIGREQMEGEEMEDLNAILPIQSLCISRDVELAY